MKFRINRYLALAGKASRRGSEELIERGRVKVNGEVVNSLSIVIDSEKDKVELDSKTLILNTYKYLLFHKPRNVITTLSDPQGRRTIKDFIPEHYGRVFPVGRLDFDVAGVLLITNDGELADKMLHPKYGVEKRYLAEVTEIPTKEQLDHLLQGVKLTSGIGRCLKVRKVPREHPWGRLILSKDASVIEMTVAEGRKHFVKQLVKGVGMKLISLSRISFGALQLGNLKEGALRELTSDEVSYITKGAG